MMPKIHRFECLGCCADVETLIANQLEYCQPCLVMVLIHRNEPAKTIGQQIGEHRTIAADYGE